MIPKYIRLPEFNQVYLKKVSHGRSNWLNGARVPPKTGSKIMEIVLMNLFFLSLKTNSLSTCSISLKIQYLLESKDVNSIPSIINGNWF
jgi:hypothetical protein